MAANAAKVGEKWKSMLVLACVASTFSFGLFLFTRGFLLTRIELANHSVSRQWQRTLGLSEELVLDGIFDEMRLKMPMNVTIQDNVPWVTFKKAVLLIIDGLRHDFISTTNSEIGSNFYRNNMQHVKHLVDNEMSKSRLFKFIADPPTTTMQRLKALTTGSLPTFIDASANFASSAILEDNLLFQLKASNKSIVFMGDDTWLDLYPNYFKRTFAYPSFDVKDLDTVDNGVLDHLVPELNKSDWGVLIAHFLGVDHCGHRYGPSHPEMKRKLLQMDSVIKDVIDNLDSDTLLYVFGDHGMTQYGDHGGDSENETTAALFVYSKRNIFSPQEEQNEINSVVTQVSIVPTLALQLGIPIPFSNVGIIIEDLFARSTYSDSFAEGTRVKEIEEIKANLSILIALYQNSEQVYDYLAQYSSLSNDIPGRTLENLTTEYLKSKSIFHSLIKSQFIGPLPKGVTNSSEYYRVAQLKNIIDIQNHFKMFIKNVYSMCFEVWAKFDLWLMVAGKLLMAVSCLLAYFLQTAISYLDVNGVESETNSYLSTISWRECIGLILNLISWLGCAVYYSTVFPVAMACTVFQILSLFFLMPSNTSLSLFAKAIQLGKFTVMDFTVPCSVAIYACCLFSNSFMIMESSLLLFLIQTLLFTWLLLLLSKYAVPRNSENKKKKSQTETKHRFMDQLVVLIACVCLRISTIFWSCREEQSGCIMTFLLGPLESLLHQDNEIRLRLILSFASIVIVVLSFYYWCRKNGNLKGLSVVSLSAKLIVPTCGVIIMLHWALQLPAKNKLVDVIAVQWVQQALLPRCAYALVFLLLIPLVWNPVSAYIVVKQTDSLEEKAMENQLNFNIQILFRGIRSRLNGNQEAHGQNKLEHEQVVYAFGLHKVYSIAYLTMMTLLLLVVILLLGDGLAFSVVLMMVVVACLYLALGNTSGPLKDTNQLNVVMLSFLASYFFFATGHQPTIPSIRFEAGFVGLQGDSSNHFLTALLISINTFSSHIIAAFILPLLHILNTTSKMEMEKDSPNENGVNGELVLQRNPLRSNRILIKSLLSYLALRMLHVTITAFVASLHRRHLMVWKIFGPRFIFEAAAFLCSIPFLIFGCLFYFRVDATVRRWMQQLDDRCNALK